MATARKRKRTTSATGTRRRRKNNRSGTKFALYAGILVIGAIGIVVYNQYPMTMASLSLHPNTAKNTSKRAFVEPDYQFYTLLPQGNAPSPATTVTAAATKPPTPAVVATKTPATAAAINTTPTTNTTAAKSPAPILAATPTPLPPAVSHHYQLQLAAFRRYEDADELKAKLILQGYPTTINSANVNGTVWYRLWIGPYNTTQQAKSVQAQLEQTHLVSRTQVVQQ